MMYFLENKSAGYVGNSPLFWAKNGAGYTQWIDEAELFTIEKAHDIIKGCKGTHQFVKWPEDKIRKIAQLTVDVQKLRK